MSDCRMSTTHSIMTSLPFFTQRLHDIIFNCILFHFDDSNPTCFPQRCQGAVITCDVFTQSKKLERASDRMRVLFGVGAEECWDPLISSHCLYNQAKALPLPTKEVKENRENKGDEWQA
jgi:hypothetical protein